MPPTVALDRLQAGPRSGEGSLAVVHPTEHAEDLALVERMLDGDERAFEAFGERYAQALWRFAVSRLAGDQERASEIVQTAMVKALSKIETYRGEASLLTWLCACCRNEILMHFRSRRRAPEEVELRECVEPGAGMPVAPPTDGEAALLSRERALQVHLVLDTLPGDYARALEWKYVEKLSMRDIAARFGRSEKSVESLLTRARDAFRRCWDAFTAPGY
jgi:RNA polymerase sigma-70 factor (ECF subfamily)